MLRMIKVIEVTGSSPVLTTARSQLSTAFPKNNIGGSIKVVTARKDEHFLP